MDSYPCLWGNFVFCPVKNWSTVMNIFHCRPLGRFRAILARKSHENTFMLRQNPPKIIHFCAQKAHILGLFVHRKCTNCVLSRPFCMHTKGRECVQFTRTFVHKCVLKVHILYTKKCTLSCAHELYTKRPNWCIASTWSKRLKVNQFDHFGLPEWSKCFSTPFDAGICDILSLGV